jgi:hypothetical protein
MQREYGISPVIATLLIVLIGCVIAMILLLAYLGMLNGFFSSFALAHPLIKITSVLHTTPQGTMKLASRIFILNTDTVEYKNRDLMAVFLKNGEELYARIHTLHGEEFIPTQHCGVSTIGGSGCRGEFFSPGEMIEINLKNGYYAPGDQVELRVYQKSSDTSFTPFIGNPARLHDLQEWALENFHSAHPGYRIISQHIVTA